MEENLTLAELDLLLKAARDKVRGDREFAAALKGIDLNEGENSESAFNRVQQKAQAEMAGMSEEEFVFDMLGIDVEED